MAPITALAEEILQLILAHITLAKHLAQCRLVCRRFNAIAEKAILNCSIVLKTENQAMSLAQHLRRCQQNGIKHLHWDVVPHDFSIFHVHNHLMPHIFTGKTVSMSGIVDEEDFYDSIDNLMDYLTETEKPNVIALPHPTQPNANYYQSLAKYQSTLQSAYIFLNTLEDINEDYIKDVFKFPKLKSLIMHGNEVFWGDFFTNFAHMESSMQLEELDLRIERIFGPGADDGAIDKDWLEAHVKKSDSMKTLSLRGDCPAYFVEVLMFMYPKLESVSLDMPLRMYATANDLLLKSEMHRILRCIENVAHKELAITSPRGHFLKEMVFCITGNGYNVSIPADQQDGRDIRMIVGGLN